tara:strand:- start:1642 stop:2091 length:450 start_codon:yes stop_codon:yes gene_type:complete
MCDNCEPEPEPDNKLRMLYTNDSKANFVCGVGKVKEESEVEKVEITDISKYDYAIGTNPIEDSDTTEDKRKLISYLTVNSIEEGIEWYRTQFPQIPEDLYPIMARWNWGDLSTITKKDIKNDTKRINKGKKPKSMCLERKVGKFVVDFS